MPRRKLADVDKATIRNGIDDIESGLFPDGILDATDPDDLRILQGRYHDAIVPEMRRIDWEDANAMKKGNTKKEIIHKDTSQEVSFFFC